MSVEATVILVERAQRGDRPALEELFARYLPRVRRIAGIRLGHSAQVMTDLEDVVQESLLDALKGLQGFRHESEGGFCSWLARCVENNIRDAARRATAKRRGGGAVLREADLSSSARPVSQAPGEGPTPSQDAMGAELDQELEAALLQLREVDREAIILRTVCGLSAEEMARELGLHTAADAQKLFERARRKLADALGI